MYGCNPQFLQSSILTRSHEGTNTSWTPGRISEGLTKRSCEAAGMVNMYIICSQTCYSSLLTSFNLITHFERQHAYCAFKSHAHSNQQIISCVNWINCPQKHFPALRVSKAIVSICMFDSFWLHWIHLKPWNYVVARSFFRLRVTPKEIENESIIQIHQTLKRISILWNDGV